jgi:hypothetical protein
MILCGKQDGASDLSPSAESQLMRDATERLPSAVNAIHRFWLAKRGQR